MATNQYMAQYEANSPFQEQGLAFAEPAFLWAELGFVMIMLGITKISALKSTLLYKYFFHCNFNNSWEMNWIDR